MKYIKYLIIIILTIFTLTSCSNNTEEYQIQVKEELTEYLYSIETAPNYPRFESNYEYAEEIIEDYSLKTTKRRHVKSNIRKGKKVLDKIILTKEKNDEVLDVRYDYDISHYNTPCGYVIGVFGDVVIYFVAAGHGVTEIYEIYGYEFIVGYYSIYACYNGTEICVDSPYRNPEAHKMLFCELLTKEDVELMFELYKSWINIFQKEYESIYNDYL